MRIGLGLGLTVGSGLGLKVGLELGMSLYANACGIVYNMLILTVACGIFHPHISLRHLDSSSQ